MERLIRGPEAFDPLAAAILAALGADDAALSAAERTVSRGGSSAMRVLFEPPMRSVRQQPGFARLAAKLGLITYWSQSGERPDVCNASSAPRLCSTLR